MGFIFLGKWSFVCFPVYVWEINVDFIGNPWISLNLWISVDSHLEICRFRTDFPWNVQKLVYVRFRPVTKWDLSNEDQQTIPIYMFFVSLNNSVLHLASYLWTFSVIHVINSYILHLSKTHFYVLNLTQ